MSANHDIPELDSAGLRNFALTTSAIVLVLFGVLIPWLFGLSWMRWPWVFAAVFSLWGLVAPSTLRVVYITWMRFGLLMSKITTPLILGAIFFLVFTPVALFMKIIGRDAMHRKIDKNATSYRIVNKKAPREKMEKPF